MQPAERVAHIDPRCPECGIELVDDHSPVVQALKVEYRTPNEHPRPDRPPVDAVFCPSCGRLLTLLAHPAVG